MRTIAALSLIPEYRKRGFLKAKFSDPQPSLQNEATGAVAVRLPVNEGLQYRFSVVKWIGNDAFTADQLNKLFKAQPSKLLDEVELDEDIRAISKAYGTQGYLEAKLNPQYTFDDAAQTVAIDIDVKEGGRYRFGTVQFNGLAGNAATELQKLWKLRQGEVFDANYPKVFLNQAGSRYNLSIFSVQINQQIHRENKTADIVFKFAPK